MMVDGQHARSGSQALCSMVTVFYCALISGKSFDMELNFSMKWLYLSKNTEIPLF